MTLFFLEQDVPVNSKTTTPRVTKKFDLTLNIRGGDKELSEEFFEQRNRSAEPIFESTAVWTINTFK